MIHQCANPMCGKPLHYLREGKIFVFDLPSAAQSPGERPTHRLQHFWLCGECAATMMMVQTPESQIQVKVKLGAVSAAKLIAS